MGMAKRRGLRSHKKGVLPMLGIDRLKPQLPLPPLFGKGTASQIAEQRLRAYRLNPKGFRTSKKRVNIIGGEFIATAAELMQNDQLTVAQAREIARKKVQIPDPEFVDDQKDKRKGLGNIRGWDHFRP